MSSPNSKSNTIFQFLILGYRDGKKPGKSYQLISFNSSFQDTFHHRMMRYTHLLSIPHFRILGILSFLLTSSALEYFQFLILGYRLVSCNNPSETNLFQFLILGYYKNEFDPKRVAIFAFNSSFQDTSVYTTTITTRPDFQFLILGYVLNHSLLIVALEYFQFLILGYRLSKLEERVELVVNFQFLILGY